MSDALSALLALATGLAILSAILAWQIILPVIGLLWLCGGLS